MKEWLCMKNLKWFGESSRGLFQRVILTVHYNDWEQPRNVRLEPGVSPLTDVLLCDAVASQKRQQSISWLWESAPSSLMIYKWTTTAMILAMTLLSFSVVLKVSLVWKPEQLLGYGLEDQRSIPRHSRICLFATTSRPKLRPIKPPVQWMCVHSSGIRRPECEVNSSRPSSAEAKTDCRYNVCLAWDKFTFIDMLWLVTSVFRRNIPLPSSGHLTTTTHGVTT
jgi:hypothetical protein